MDYIIELLVELLLDGIFDITDTKTTPKLLKYPLIILILFILLGITAVIITTAILTLKEIPTLGVLLIIIGISFITYACLRFKHIYSIRNPKSDDSKVWNIFIEKICTKKLSELNNIQKNAALCFYYDREMNIGGHICYFDNYQKVKNEDLIKALTDVANKKYVEILKEAIETGKEDNYEKTDSLYKKISPCLTEYIEEYVIKNKKQILEEKQNRF